MQPFDVPLFNAPNAALPNTLRDAEATCGGTGTCAITSAYLTEATSTANAPSLAVSVDALPNIIVRNLGTSTANGLAITASGYAVTTNCGMALAPSGVCAVALAGTGPGTLSVSAANAATQSFPLPATTSAADSLAVLPSALDFGIVTSASPVARVATVTNLSGSAQTFNSALDIPARMTLPYSVSEASDCATTGTGAKTLAAGASCHITLTLTSSTAASNDGALAVAYKIGNHDVALTGFGAAAALTVSSATIDFGTQFLNGLRLPRYLYLSNNSPAPVTHAAVAIPAPFTVVDACRRHWSRIRFAG